MKESKKTAPVEPGNSNDLNQILCVMITMLLVKFAIVLFGSDK